MIHPHCVTAGIHVTSSIRRFSLQGKIWNIGWMVHPSASSASATRFPSPLSRKNSGGSVGGGFRLRTDDVFDLRARQVEVVGDVLHFFLCEKESDDIAHAGSRP